MGVHDTFWGAGGARGVDDHRVIGFGDGGARVRRAGGGPSGEIGVSVGPAEGEERALGNGSGDGIDQRRFDDDDSWIAVFEYVVQFRRREASVDGNEDGTQ